MQKYFLKIIKKYNKFKYMKQLYILRFLGANIHKSVTLHGLIVVKGNPKNLCIKANCSLNDGVIINCRKKVILDEGVTISSNVQIHTGALLLNKIPRKHRSADVYIGKNVWLAAQCVINPGVVISEGIVVGANSLVTKSLDKKNTFYAGSPVKEIKKIEYTEQ